MGEEYERVGRDAIIRMEALRLAILHMRASRQDLTIEDTERLAREYERFIKDAK